jgi:Ca2+-binding EF-hand superfamily protein
MNSRFWVLGGLLALLVVPATHAAGGRGGPALERLDSNGDGRISFDEFQMPPEGRGPRFERADSDGDGAVSRDEMQAAARDKYERAQQQLGERFDAMDADGNGVVTPEERRTYAFTRLDGNGDGYIDEAEADAAREMHHKRRGGPSGRR